MQVLLSEWDYGHSKGSAPHSEPGPAQASHHEGAPQKQVHSQSAYHHQAVLLQRPHEGLQCACVEGWSAHLLEVHLHLTRALASAALLTSQLLLMQTVGSIWKRFLSNSNGFTEAQLPRICNEVRARCKCQQGKGPLQHCFMNST